MHLASRHQVHQHEYLQWHQPELGLQDWHTGHLHESRYKVIAPQVPAPHPKTTPEIPPPMEPPKL